MAVPGSAPREAGLSKAVQSTGDTPWEGCLNTSEGTVQQSPGHVELNRTQMADSWVCSGMQAPATLQDRGWAEGSSHNERAAPILQGLDGEAGEVRDLRTRSWVEVLVMNSGVQRGDSVGQGPWGRCPEDEGGSSNWALKEIKG